MHLSLDEEQRLLAESARGFVARTCDTRQVRELETAEPGYDESQWARMGELEWPGLVVPQEHGGAGRGLLELAVLGEELGRGPVPTPLLTAATLGALPILWAGRADQRERWLPALATGASVATLALLEPGMRDEWDEVSMEAPLLQGTKVLVPWAKAADVLVVATTGGPLLVETARPGVAIERHDGLGGDPVYSVTFDGTEAEPLGNGRPAVLERVLEHAAIAQLSYTVGVAERALDLSVEHARTREQFGRPIGSFQAVAHRCADMRADVDACRYLAYQAAWALDGGNDAAAPVAAAKAYASDALRRVSMHAHQVHGAMGFSTEHDLHLFTRRMKAFELSFGGASRHRDRLAAAMGLR